MTPRKSIVPIIVILAAATGQAAHADQYGCTVALCMGNPAGPKAAGGDCPPAIDRLYRDLRRGKPFPTCQSAGNPAAVTGYYAGPVTEWFADCPPGLTAVEGLVMQAMDREAWRSGMVNVDGIGTPGPRACVGKQVDTATTSGEYGSLGLPVRVYDRIVVQEPLPRTVIKVFMDGKPFEAK